jgi:hypothetical protein
MVYDPNVIALKKAYAEMSVAAGITPKQLDTMLNSMPSEDPYEDMLSELFSQYPVLNKIKSCPERLCTTRQEFVRGIVMHLNDKHKWSREQIADWVDSLEGH